VRPLGRLLGVLVVLRAAWRAAHDRRPPRSLEGATDAVGDPTSRKVPADRRAETAVAVLLVLAALFGFGFTAVYVASGTNTQLLGVTIGGMLALLAAAAIVAGKRVVPVQTSVGERPPLHDQEAVQEVAAELRAGADGISRRALLTGAGGLAGAAVATAAATPLASLGPTLGHIHTTPWREGVRLVDDQGRPYLASEIEIGSFYTALPEGGDRESFGAGLVVVRLAPSEIHLPAARRNWAPGGVLAYSKICPHAGCAISLYRYPQYAPTSPGPALTCPCHYSSFSPGEGGRLLFGPAGRALPQLPLTVDQQGYLRAAGPFHEDIGPSWWDVHRGQA
jgi:ubiquinol-cytochrome c reductase iron-sulfur subunit